MSNQKSAAASEPFAIVGLSLKLPQEAIDEASLWEVLESGKNLGTEWPEDRIVLDSFTTDGELGKPNTIKSRSAHFVKEDPAVFDAPFFSITTKEATGMNPQQRWALEAAYHAFENAGIPAESLSGSRTAVFATYMMDDFMNLSMRDPDQLPQQAAIGLAPMIIPNRVSWYFNLKGPSVLVETGCSSAMVAIDSACNAMRSGDADMALVVGSTLLLSPESTIMLSTMNFLSADGRSYTFDDRANGYARGEGAVALVLKPLSRAIADGDVLRAVIRSTGQNQDGRTPIMTQPSATAQEALIRHVYHKAGLGMDETRYFEAHGTGTPIGDVIEMTGIGEVFREHRSSDEPLYVGSIKPNIGHIEGASACASIVKSIMILEKGVIPPSALMENMNPGIDAKFYNVQVPTKSIQWPASGLRRVSINSFGAGGANAHAILDDAYHYLKAHGLEGFHQVQPSLTNKSNGANGTNGTNGSVSTHSSSNNGPKLLVWSAIDRGAVQRMLDAYAPYFSAQMAGDAGKLARLAYTLAERRSVMAWRSFAVVDADTSQLSATEAVRASSAGGESSIAFVFTGQGAQHVGMGLELRRYPVFEASLKRSDEILAGLGCEWSLFDQLQNAEGIHRPESSQPLCTALQIALIELLHSFGILPAAVLGHSSGEIAAAYAIGALSHESACRVAYWRGQLASKLRAAGTYNGAMMSVNLAESEVPAYLDKAGLDTITVACVNSPTNVTLSGPSDALDVLKTQLDEQEIFALKVNTGVAYHSPTMRAIANEYMERLGELQAGDKSRKTDIPMVSSVSGQIASPKLLGMPNYWVENLVSPVRFSDAMRRLPDLGAALSLLPPGVDAITDVVEIGPHPALRRPVKDNLTAISSKIRYHYSVERSKSALHTIATLAGTLFCHGQPVSVAAVNAQAKGCLPALVDCPPYPFNHSRRYWNESRMSRDYRLRTHSISHLLGKRSNDWNALHPRWRNWLSVEGMPWMADHMISDQVVCPGTGMAVMAMEAVKQLLVGDSRVISGFLVRQGQFLAPIPVGKTLDDAAETELHLRPITRAYEKEAKWFEARIFSYREDRWTENFRAEIQAQFDETDAAGEVDGGQETRLHRQQVRDHVEQAFERCAEAVNSDAFYSFLREYGSQYGESFRQLTDMKWDGQTTAVARVDMGSAKKHYQYHPQHQAIESPFHPAVLDAAVHLVNCYVSKGLTEPLPTLVPQRFASLWVSAKVWDQETESLRLVSELRDPESSSSAGAVDKNLYALADDGEPLAVFEHLTYMQVSRAREGDSLSAEQQPLLYGITWKPQLSTLAGQELQKLCDGAVNTHEATSVDFVAKIERAIGAAARKALNTVTQEHLDSGPVFLRKYAASLQHQFGSEAAVLDEEALESLLSECEAEQPAWRLLPSIARGVGPILRGEADPMELMFSDAAAARDYYSDMARSFMSDGRFTHFLDLASHETPGLKVLEVGAGTGGMTRHVLAALQGFEAETGQTRFGEYAFTDLSPAFFDGPREEFSAWGDRVSFKVLDISQDPASQGFEAAGYDVVVAASVLHATPDLSKTLSNVRSLLRPGGHLVLVEPVSDKSACVNVSFGCFEGWWVGSEDWRQDGPLATEQRWGELLHGAGFSGSVLTVRDQESKEWNFSSMMVATAIEGGEANGANGVNGHNLPELLLLCDPHSDIQVSLAADIAKQHPAKTIDLASFGRVPDNSVVISLLEVEQPQLASLPEADFSLLKELIQAAPNLLWVTSPSASPDEDVHANTDPYYSVATGLLRVIRSEYPTKRVVTLRVEQDPSSRTRFISEVLQGCFLDRAPSAEAEFVVQQGHLTIARMVREITLDESRIARTSPRLHTEPWQSEGGRAAALEVGTPGLLDTLHFRDDPLMDTPLQDNEVEIKASVWPLSFRDLFIALGRLGHGEQMGFECAGIVTRVGASCESIRPGDRVVMGAMGSIRSHPRAPAEDVLKIPDALSLQEAVAGIVPGMTAYHALVTVARLQPGETIIIHSAAGATGQFAIGVALMLGAEVLATVGHKDKKQLLMDRFGIPEHHIFDSRNTSFAQGVRRVTNGRGVDVVLNSLSGDSLRASWECIAPYGRFVEIGKVDIGADSLLPMGRFAKNASFAAVDMVHIQMTNKKLARQLMEKVLELAASPDFMGNPAPLHVYPVSDVEKAFRYMQSGKHSGRILLGAQDEDLVSKLTIQRSTWRFDENASYVVAGGLGGLGRPMIRWMADRGAKNIIVLSRSGAASQAAIDLVAELQAKKVNILTPRCDISSPEEVSAAIATANLPPIKGCINATMVLQDSIFENMTHEQWSRTIRSKVNTSWNLHQLLPSDLDFFILLSSIVGVYGSPGQGNYAAGCTFQDALARSRTASGRHRGASVSLDLGWMRDDGVVRESADLQRRLTTTALFNPVATADLLAVLDHYCDPDLPPLAPDQSQLVIGASTPAEARARGSDASLMTRTRLFAGFDVARSENASLTGNAKEEGADAARLFNQSTDPVERTNTVVTALRANLARAMGVEVNEVNPDKGLVDYGVDSLMAVELRNWIRRDFGVSLAVFEIMQNGKKIKDVGELIVSKAA